MYNDYMDDLELAYKIAEKVNTKGGKAYFVGGYIRDKLRNIKNDDIDIEIHGLDVEKVESILRDFGHINNVGKSFGIFKISGSNLDIALPRKEISTGKGHKDFEIVIDPYCGEYISSKRRDFTINSIMQNILTGDIIDHFDGIKDIKSKTIRHITDKSFIEDPLRVFRACQFASRFNYNINEDTINLCKEIDIEILSKERVFEEVSKALLLSNKASLFFDYLDKCNKLKEWFIEIEQMKSIKENPKYHKEDNLYIHTMMVLDKACEYRDKVNNELFFMYAALCHDIGKLETTETIDGTIHSYKHEIVGIELSEKFLKRFTNNKKLIRYVKNMVEYHMKPNLYARDNSKVKSSNTLFFNSIDPNDLVYLAICDNYGRISEDKFNPKDYLFERLEIYKEYMNRPYVDGNDLIKNGIKPNKNYKKILEYATKLRLAGINKEDALKQVLSYAKKEGNK